VELEKSNQSDSQKMANMSSLLIKAMITMFMLLMPQSTFFSNYIFKRYKKKISGKKLSSAKTGGDTIFDMDSGSYLINLYVFLLTLFFILVNRGTYKVAIANKRGLTFFTFDGLLDTKRGMFAG
jgi:hypothetical protein